jgi:EAL domain-containing protein (putative c-di-GMP-specific phosphodiesterase class I)
MPGDPQSLAAFLVTQPDRADHAAREVSIEALRAIRTHLGMDVAFISEFTDGQRVFRQLDAASQCCPVSVGDAQPLEESYCQRVVDGRLPELIHDASKIPAAMELPVTAALPVGAHLSVPIRLQDGRVYGTFCCFSYAPDHSLNDRDIAMMRVFADLTAAQIERELESDHIKLEAADRLQAVIAGEGLAMAFQPVIDVGNGKPIGFEALARFSGTPPRGPDAWFAEAAGVGLGVELEVTAVRLAVADLPRLPPHAYLAINVSPLTVVSGQLDTLLAEVPAQRIVLEVTEHAAIETYEQLQAALKVLRGRGMRLAVDDVGAGYASFRHILRLRPDIIKLDMALTRDIDRDPARRALASALITFAGSTGSTIVAEGVETAGELHALRRLGVTTAQGYYLGRPTPLPDFRDAALAVG